MRIYEEVERKIKERVLVGIKCDLCGANAKSCDWSSSTFEINNTEIRVEVRQKDGHSYPDGGWGTEYRVEICPKCFKNKLIPWLESHGCPKKQVEWDW